MFRTEANSQIKRAPGRPGSATRDEVSREDEASTGRTARGRSVSIVLPILNEEGNIAELYKRLASVVDESIIEKDSAELLFVDDGSTDSSVPQILGLREKDKRVKLVRLSRNFGHQAAITAGMELSQGDAVVLMDADLQDPPELLHRMLEMWQDGADVVYAVRNKRDESFWKRSTAFAFYRILQRIANIDIPLDTGDFCLMDRRVVEQLNRFPEKNRYLRGLRSWVGFNQAALGYERDARRSGKTKYTFRSMARLAVHGIFSFSTFPLRLATYLGFIAFLFGFIFLAFIVVAYFVNQQWPQGWASLIVVTLFLGGTQLLILGTIGEYVAMISDEVKQRPNYVVREFYD